MQPRRLALTLLALLALLSTATTVAAQEEDDDEAPDCPTDLVAASLESTGGAVFMTWTLNSLTDVNVYRAVGDGEFVLTDRHEFPQTRHLDEDVVAGTTYRYRVTAIDDEGRESEVCTEAEVTVIPFFPGWVGFVAASTLGVASYVAVRRRR
jgi:fibronectin type 3 domain-containing protein